MQQMSSLALLDLLIVIEEAFLNNFRGSTMKIQLDQLYKCYRVLCLFFWHKWWWVLIQKLLKSLKKSGFVKTGICNRIYKSIFLTSEWQFFSYFYKLWQYLDPPLLDPLRLRCFKHCGNCFLPCRLFSVLELIQIYRLAHGKVKVSWKISSAYVMFCVLWHSLNEQTSHLLGIVVTEQDCVGILKIIVHGPFPIFFEPIQKFIDDSQFDW